MLRDLMVNANVVADATFVADAAMTTGMAVIKNYTDGTADLVSAETASNLFFVQKARIPTGINAYRSEFSDWNTNFTAVAANEPVVLYSYPAGTTFGTDAYAAALTNDDAGCVLSSGTDGKLKKATSTSVSSVYKFIKLYTDGSHTLAKVEVLDTATANA